MQNILIIIHFINEIYFILGLNKWRKSNVILIRIHL